MDGVAVVQFLNMVLAATLGSRCVKEAGVLVPIESHTDREALTPVA